MSATDALAELYAVEGPRLRSFLRRFGNAVSAEDIAQDAFSRLCATDLTQVASPRAYLFRTACNLALNELKRKSIAPTAALADLVELTLPPDTPSPEERVIASDEAERLRGILELLPERQRQALILFKVEGLSHKEIALQLGCSHRSVERYVADAIAHCYEYLSAFERED